MATKNPQRHFVVYCFTRYQDCSEEHTKLFNDIGDAVKYIEEGMNDRHSGGMSQYHLFELGPEIELSFKQESTQPPPPPPVVKTTVALLKK